MELLNVAKKVITSPVVAQLAMTAAKTAIVCGVIVGSQLIVVNRFVNGTLGKIAQEVGKRADQEPK